MPKIKKEKLSYAIIGAGAVGGFYGAMLQKSGFDVHYLFKSAYETVSSKGLSILLPDKGAFHLNVHAYNDVKKMPKCDVVLITLKTTHNHLILELIRPLLKKDTLLVIIQNGIGNEEVLSSVFLNHPILSGITSIGATPLGPGIINIFHEGSLKLAQYGVCSITPFVKKISEDFISSGIKVLPGKDYLLARWEKLLWNAPFNGLSVIYNTSVDILAKNKSTLLKELAAELITIAASYQRNIPHSYFESLLSSTQKLNNYKPSMKIDFEANKPMEIEYIYEKPLALAKAKDISCPILEETFNTLKYLQTK